MTHQTSLEHKEKAFRDQIGRARLAFQDCIKYYQEQDHGLAKSHLDKSVRHLKAAGLDMSTTRTSQAASFLDTNQGFLEKVMIDLQKEVRRAPRRARGFVTQPA